MALITAGSIILAFFAAVAFFRADELRLAQSRLSLYSRSLSDTLSRFDYLPFILAQDPRIARALADFPDALNKPFADYAERSGLEAIYLMDRTGLVVASSNFDRSPTFLGQNYGFRAYFRSALSGSEGRLFGVGATTGRPGYFYAKGVRAAEGAIEGVLAVKLDMSEFQASWEASGDNVLVTDERGIVVLATNPAWLYRATRNGLSSETIRDLRASRQFGDHQLRPLGWQLLDNRVVLNGRNYLHAKATKTGLGWTVHFLQDERRVIERAGFATAIVGSIIVILVLIATYLRSVRIQQALERSQADRGRLMEANAELEDVHLELKRSGQLAALGQLAASVTHELGQPISALKNYLSAAEASGEMRRADTLPKIERVIERIENIARELRFFSKPRHESLKEFDFREALARALELVNHDIERTNCLVTVDAAKEALPVRGNQFRMERVIVNLARNALEAMEDSQPRELAITVHSDGRHMRCVFADTGPGLSGQSIDTLREPFHTTKPSGSGMGLGLSIAEQIVVEHGGTLTARDGSAGGAQLEIVLPIAHRIPDNGGHGDE